MELEIHKSTTVDFNNYLCKVMRQELIENTNRIRGSVNTVYINKSMLSRRKQNLGRTLPQQWVFEGICRERNFLNSCYRVKYRKLLHLMAEYICTGSTVRYACWPSYNYVEGVGFEQRKTNHSLYFVHPED